MLLLPALNNPGFVDGRRSVCPSASILSTICPFCGTSAFCTTDTCSRLRQGAGQGNIQTLHIYRWMLKNDAE